MEIYAITGENTPYICRRAHAPSGAVLMNIQRPSKYHTCSTDGCADGFGVWILDPMKEWEAAMTALDASMSRATEDIWDVIGIQNAPQAVKDAYTLKKEERDKKPK